MCKNVLLFYCSGETMERFSGSIIKRKFLVIIIVLIIAFLSAAVMNRVFINYNNADYLPSDTETAIGLKIMDQEFGLSGNILLMVSDIDKTSAVSLLTEIKGINAIISASFNPDSEEYYKDGNALYVIMIDGGNYSTVTKSVISQLDTIVASHGYEATYGGSAVETLTLMNAITKEIPYVLVICVVLASIILILTSTSWIEPFLFLFVSGVGIIINRGSNIMFGQVSYITNSIAAILQLALSMDYGIVLLHMYHEKQKEFPDNKQALKAAMVQAFNPISASALTTIAGLMALLFMTFRIGFDIGIVLSKGILISAILAFTLFPGIILIFDKLMHKTRKKPIVLKSGFLARITLKNHFMIIALALIVIITGGILMAFNTYSFNDSKFNMNAITDTFGYNNTLVILYPNANDSLNIDKQNQLQTELTDYKIDGKPILSGFTSYADTVYVPLSVNSVSDMLGADQASISDLFALYHVYQDKNDYEMDFDTFVKYVSFLVVNDNTVSQYMDQDTKNVVAMLQTLESLTKTKLDYQNMFDEINSIIPNNTSGFDALSIQQAYGLYSLDNRQIQNPSVDFRDMLDFIIQSSTQNQLVSSMIDSSTLTSLEQLKTGIDELLQPVTQAEFQAKMQDQYGMTITNFEVNVIYTFYFNQLGIPVEDTIPYINILNMLVEQNEITDETQRATITQYYNTCQDYVLQNYDYTDFIPALGSVITGLTGTIENIPVSTGAVEQLYVLYFYANNLMPDTKLTGGEFVNYLVDKTGNDDFISNYLGTDGIKMLEDFQRVVTRFEDISPLNYQQMSATLTNLQESIQTLDISSSISEDLVAGIYAKYAISEDLGYAEPIPAELLLGFLSNNMSTNTLISDSLTQSDKSSISQGIAVLNETKDLLVGKTYSRIIINVDLATDDENSYNFARYLSALVKTDFGSNTYVAGEIMSTMDLRDSFHHDVIVISVLSALAILVIIMLIYRSLSIPVLLVVIIQGSIWVAMSFAFVSGNKLFFMSYIVANCILMGATIDYGILISSRYIESRLTHDKAKSIELALRGALPSIFTSGTILVICGFTVYFVSTQTSILTVGILLGVGTTCSLLMVLFALPSFLYLLDRLILKTTYKTKNIQDKKL